MRKSIFTERLFHNIHYDILIEIITPEETLINKHEIALTKSFNVHTFDFMFLDGQET